MGKLPVIRMWWPRSRTTAAAPSCFSVKLIAALTILQRGDLPLSDLIGAYAGEIGRARFLPSSYIKYGVDFDGNGHVDLRHSVPDVLASTANLLKTNGWQAGAPYGEGTRLRGGAMRMEPAPWSTERPSCCSPSACAGRNGADFVRRVADRPTSENSTDHSIDRTLRRGDQDFGAARARTRKEWRR